MLEQEDANVHLTQIVLTKEWAYSVAHTSQELLKNVERDVLAHKNAY